MRTAPIVVALVTLTSAFLPASSAGALPLSTRARCISRSGPPIEQALKSDDELVVIQEWAILDTLDVDHQIAGSQVRCSNFSRVA
jgi:hypothetical protein